MARVFEEIGYPIKMVEVFRTKVLIFSGFNESSFMFGVEFSTLVFSSSLFLIPIH